MENDVEQNVLMIVALLLSMTGAVLLYLAWQARRSGKRTRRTVLVTAAWSVLLVSLLPWSIAGGDDRGVALAIIAMTLAGSVLVLRAGFRHRVTTYGRKAKPERETREDVTLNARALLLRRTWVFLLAGPVAAVASVFLAATLFAAWDVETGSAANRLAAVILAVPALWTLLAIYATYDAPLRYRSLIVTTCLLAGLAGTFLPTAGVA